MSKKQADGMKVNTTDYDNPAEFELMPEARQQWMLAWIERHVRRAKRRERRYRGTSYGLKHIIERDYGDWIGNGQTKGAMIASNYAPMDSTEKTGNGPMSLSTRRSCSNSSSPGCTITPWRS